ncbi:hypothetical protein T08_10171 [Trichinella sp. T8]|nr:hypothetical protein T08_10171 [Trichinella sp. T8]
MSHAGFRRLRTSVNTSMCKQVYTTLWWLRSTPTALASLSCIETAPVSVNETPEARKTDNTTRKQYKERRLAKDRSFEQLAPVVKRLKVPSNLNNRLQQRTSLLELICLLLHQPVFHVIFSRCHFAEMCNCCATRYP